MVNKDRWALNTKYQLFGVMLFILLFIVGYLFYRSFAEPKVSYTTEKANLGVLEKTVTSLGSLQPKDYVDIGAQVSGQLKKVYVEVGDIVKKGQLLAEIDSTVYQSKVDADRASLTDLRAQVVGQRAELRLAEKTHRRIRMLVKVGAVSQKERDEAEAAYSDSKASLDSLYAQIKKAESTLSGDLANLGYTKIYAPVDGTVVSQTVLEGQTINSSQTAPTLLRIANLDVMTLNADVAESDVPNIRVGLPVYFTTLGHSNRKWQSVVRQIMPTPTITNNVVLYKVLVDVDNQDRRLMTQMTAQVFFVLERVENLPIVPIKALEKTKDQKGYQLSVLTASGIQTRRVKVALMNRTKAAIAEGVKPEEKVVMKNAQVATKTPSANMSPAFPLKP